MFAAGESSRGSPTEGAAAKAKLFDTDFEARF